MQQNKGGSGVLDFITRGWNAWVEGWKNSWVITKGWAGSGTDILFEVLIITAMIGVLMNMAGWKQQGDKVIFISVMIALVIRVVALYV
jgi:hypothetical protein